jgi:ligand-binding SRPBCC domain-containing protein
VKIIIETEIAAPVERCFDLARDVELHARAAAFSGERLVPPGRMSGLLELGDLVAFEGVHFGVSQRFVARIIELEPPRRFVDEMVEGAFRSLRHEHEFHIVAGGTLMRDILEWRSPLGFLGRLADHLFVRRHMEWFVRTKQANLKRVIERREERL